MGRNGGKSGAGRAHFEKIFVVGLLLQLSLQGMFIQPSNSGPVQPAGLPGAGSLPGPTGQTSQPAAPELPVGLYREEDCILATRAAGSSDAAVTAALAEINGQIAKKFALDRLRFSRSR